MTLDQLSAAATEAQRLLPEFYLSPFYKTEYARPCDKVKAAIAFTLTRTGQLVAVADDAVDRVARAIGTSLAYDIGMDVRAGSLTDDEKRKVATKAIAAMKDTQP